LDLEEEGEKEVPGPARVRDKVVLVEVKDVGGAADKAARQQVLMGCAFVQNADSPNLMNAACHVHRSCVRSAARPCGGIDSGYG